jgi:enoyl-[acyl-carrier-protein] reductase (NADH)
VADLAQTRVQRSCSLRWSAHRLATARKLSAPAAVLELDVTVDEHLDSVRADLQERWGRVDGVLHAIGFAPPNCLGGHFMDATWADVSVAMQISAYSFKALADCFAPLMTSGGSFVGLDFDATVAWPAYDWMGVAKAALESTSRYMARELGPRGIRVNLVAAGPIRTMAAKSIPESRTASWPAPMARCTKRLIRRAILASITALGSKPMTSAAMCTSWSAESKPWIVRVPVTPACRFAQ